jgi:hypothetical protein
MRFEVMPFPLVRVPAKSAASHRLVPASRTAPSPSILHFGCFSELSSAAWWCFLAPAYCVNCRVTISARRRPIPAGFHSGRQPLLLLSISFRLVGLDLCVRHVWSFGVFRVLSRYCVHCCYGSHIRVLRLPGGHNPLWSRTKSGKDNVTLHFFENRV